MGSEGLEPGRRTPRWLWPLVALVLVGVVVLFVRSQDRFASTRAASCASLEHRMTALAAEPVFAADVEGFPAAVVTTTCHGGEDDLTLVRRRSGPIANPARNEPIVALAVRTGWTENVTGGEPDRKKLPFDARTICLSKTVDGTRVPLYIQIREGDVVVKTTAYRDRGCNGVIESELDRLR